MFLTHNFTVFRIRDIRYFWAFGSVIICTQAKKVKNADFCSILTSFNLPFLKIGLNLPWVIISTKK
jgi:hypothetical protein